MELSKAILTDEQVARLSGDDLRRYFAPCLNAVDLEEDHAPYDGEHPKPEPKRSVYFIQCGGSGPIKIGIARSPEKRLANLQTAHYEKLTIRALGQGGAVKEAEYHRQFAEHRLHGEWFEPHPDILAEIERLSQPLRPERN